MPVRWGQADERAAAAAPRSLYFCQTPHATPHPPLTSPFPPPGAILVLGRDLVMVPKLIHPLPPQQASPRGSDSDAGGEAGPPNPALDTWMQAVNDERPPTPPRGRAGSGSPSLAFFE